MKNSKLKILFIVMVLIMTVSALLVGCKGKTSEPETTATAEPTKATQEVATDQDNEEAPAEDNPYEEHLELSWIVYNQADVYPEKDTPVQKLIEERFNVTLDIQELDIFNEDEWTLFWASGGMADRIQCNSMGKYIYEFADQGIIRPIEYSWLNEYAPGVMEIVMSLVDEDYLKQSVIYKDQLWCLPNSTSASPFLSHIMYIRKGWMDQVGVTAVPTTMEEYHDLAYKFTYEDPDNNGEDDTYGISWHHGAQMQQFYYFWGATGLGVNTFTEADGKVSFSSVQPEFKDALITLAEWYAEGIIDPEFITDDRTSQRAKWSAGKFGILEDSPWWFSPTTNNNLTDMVLDNFPEEELIAVAPYEGKSGQSGSAYSLPDMLGTSTYFGAEASDEKVLRIFAIEEAKSDWDWYVRLYYGVEGEDWSYDDEGTVIVNPDIEITSEYVTEKGIRQTFGLTPRDVDMYMKTVQPVDRETYTIGLTCPKYVSARYGGFAKDFAAGQNVALEEKGEDLSSILTEFIIGAITGSIDIDAEWDGYVQSMKDNGLDAIIAEYEASLAQ